MMVNIGKEIGGFESFCYQNCQRILLRLRNYQYAELYINATLSLEFEKETGKIGTASGIRSLLPSIDKYCHRLAYDTDYLPEEVLKINAQYLNDFHKPFIAGVDSFYLPYTVNYNVNHARHTLIVIRISKNVEVIDWYPPWFYCGAITLKDFLKARSSENPYDGTMYSGGRIENNWAYIDEFSPYESATLFKELLETVYLHYYNEHMSVEAEKDNKDIFLKKSYGLEALIDIKEYICSNNNQLDSKHCYILFKRALKRNDLFLQYLKSYKEVINSYECDSLINISENIVEAKEVLLLVLLKYLNCGTQKTRSRLESKFNLLIELESRRKEQVKLMKK